MVTPYFDKSVVTFFQGLDQKLQRGSSLSKRDSDHVFRSCLDFLGLPVPDRPLYQYFLNSQFIAFLLHQLADKSLPPEHYTKYDNLINTLRQERFRSFIQYRELDVNGIYPNLTIARRGARYIINQGYPILITSNHSSEYIPSSEVAWITRNELKFATSVACAAADRTFYLFISYPGGVRVDHEHLKAVPAAHRTPFLAEWTRIQNYFSPTNGLFSRTPKRDITGYEFGPFEKYLPEFDELYSAFHIRDQLLMRTASCFVKAILLWTNPVFGEDAIANVFFSLEGCLFLIQRKHGNTEKKINRTQLKAIFEKTFPRGEELFEFITEAYDKRISIVHPLPRWGSEWSPFLSADDYFDYLHICKSLLNYVLMERIIQDE
jgi:hypothetical protein